MIFIERICMKYMCILSFIIVIFISCQTFMSEKDLCKNNCINIFRACTSSSGYSTLNLPCQSEYDACMKRCNSLSSIRIHKNK